MVSWDEALRRAKAEAPERFPSLSKEFRTKLRRITPAQSIYFPVVVTLRTGEQRDAVYLSPAIPWFEQWAVWPDEDAGKRSLSLEDILDFEESPTRLPPEFAEVLYAAGESGMGYQIFQLHFRDGSTASFGTGNAIDFAGRDDRLMRGARDHAWCLFNS
jgi:hypothetical protein